MEILKAFEPTAAGAAAAAGLKLVPVWVARGKTMDRFEKKKWHSTK